MPITGNKRVSQLVELTAIEVQPNDLLMVVDSIGKESKRMQFSEFQMWLESIAGSVILAETASYVSGNNVYGTVNNSINAISSSYSNNSGQSLTSVSSSYALTASYALNGSGSSGNTSDSSSYLIYTGIPNGTASYAIKSLNSDVSTNALFLVYTGGNNGTSSYAITTQNVQHATNADTASYISGGPSVTASYEIYAGDAGNSSTANVANSSNYLNFSPNNGTSSYAIVAESTKNRFNNYGLFLPNSQDTSSAIIDNLNVSSSLGTTQQTLIEVFGNAILAYTASIPNSGSLYLAILDRLTGDSAIIDKTTLSYNVTSLINQWGSLSTGSINIPFNLVAQLPLYGNYYTVVTASSSNITLDSNRPVKFTISSYSDNLSVFSAQYPEFYLGTLAPQYITFSTITNPGPFYDYLPGLLITGSSNIYQMDVSYGTVTAVDYTWKCSNLVYFNCNSNPSLTSLDYTFPITMSYLYCNNCNLYNIVDIDNTQIIDFDCSFNQLMSLPTFPATLIKFNCSNNLLTSLPFLPPSIQSLYCDNNNINSISIFPSDIITASLSNCGLVSLASFPNTLEKLIISNNITLTSLPSSSLNVSMSYLNVSNCSLTLLPTMSISMSYLDISNNTFLSIAQIESCTSDLVTNAQISGTISAPGYGSPARQSYYIK